MTTAWDSQACLVLNTTNHGKVQIGILIISSLCLKYGSN